MVQQRRRLSEDAKATLIEMEEAKKRPRLRKLQRRTSEEAVGRHPPQHFPAMTILQCDSIKVNGLALSEKPTLDRKNERLTVGPRYYGALRSAYCAANSDDPLRVGHVLRIYHMRSR